MFAANVSRRLLVSGLRRVNSRMFRRDLPNRIALYFHSLDIDQARKFERLADWLSSNGYRFSSPSQYIAEDSPHVKKVFISFDDNYVSWYEHLPLLSKNGVQCTFYVNTAPLRDRSSPEEQSSYFDRISFFGKRVPLSSEELRTIAAEGHTVACHAHSHRNLNALPLPEAQREMLISKQILEEILGSPVEDFSYPFGMPRHFSRPLQAYASSIGFKRIAQAVSCMLHEQSRPPYIHRHGWDFERDLDHNLRNAAIDGRLFVKALRRNPIA